MLKLNLSYNREGKTIPLPIPTPVKYQRGQLPLPTTNDYEYNCKNNIVLFNTNLLEKYFSKKSFVIHHNVLSSISR